MSSALDTVIGYTLWPALLSVCIALSAWGMAGDHGILVFNIVYLGLAATLFVLERLRPYARDWLCNDGQILVDLGHTLINKGSVQVLVFVSTVFGIAEAVGTTGSDTSHWPAGWPIWTQVGLGLLLAETGLYSAHRLAHEWPLLWRFHAVHHSSRRLTFINTGRFHVVDTVTSILLSQPLLFIAGAPIEIFQWVAAITAFIGILTHCNIDMRFGFLSYLFNTPVLHRWHHSKVLDESNRNYGENLMLFDLIFRTFYSSARKPSTDIGINEPMPDTLLGQIAHPFRQSVR